MLQTRCNGEPTDMPRRQKAGEVGLEINTSKNTSHANDPSNCTLNFLTGSALAGCASQLNPWNPSS